jgi:hypothetical protein
MDHDPVESVRRQRDAVLDELLHVIDDMDIYFSDELLEVWPELAVRFPQHCSPKDDDC